MLINNFYVMIIIFFYMIIFFNLQFVLVKYFFMLVEFAHPIFLRRRLRRICVRGICAQMCAGEFARKLCADFVRRICVQICAGEFCAECAAGKCSADICAECAAGNFLLRGCAREFFSFADVRGDVFGDGRGNSGPKMGAGGAGGAKKGQKGPKMPKMAQNGQKWPKRGGGVPKKGPKWHILSPSGTRVVRGPLRLIAQGGKSRQNMH